MAGEPYNEIVYKAAEKIIAGGGGTVSNPTVVTQATASLLNALVSGAAADNAPASGSPVPVGSDYNATTPTYANLDRATLQADANGNLRSLIIMQQGAGSDAVSNASLMFPGSQSGQGIAARLISTAPHKYNGASWDRDRKPNAVSRIPSSAATTNATSAKATAGDLCNVTGYNSSATVTYLKLYNKATAPTVGTDTPFVTIALAPTATFSLEFNSLYFSTGIAYGLTTDAADAGTTAVAAGAILGLNVVYA